MMNKLKDAYCTNTREYTNIPSCSGKIVFAWSRLQEEILILYIHTLNCTKGVSHWIVCYLIKYRIKTLISVVWEECLLSLQNICFDVHVFIKCALFSGPQVIKLFSCSTQLSTKFQLLINTKIPTNKEVSCLRSLWCCIYHANKC